MVLHRNKLLEVDLKPEHHLRVVVLNVWYTAFLWHCKAWIDQNVLGAKWLAVGTRPLSPRFSPAGPCEVVCESMARRVTTLRVNSRYALGDSCSKSAIATDFMFARYWSSRTETSTRMPISQKVPTMNQTKSLLQALQVLSWIWKPDTCMEWQHCRRNVAFAQHKNVPVPGQFMVENKFPITQSKPLAGEASVRGKLCCHQRGFNWERVSRRKLLNKGTALTSFADIALRWRS